MNAKLEPWRAAWRVIAGLLTDDHLRALRRGLLTDDPALVQGWTVLEPGGPVLLGRDEGKPPVGACAIGYAGWHGEEMDRVDQVLCFFQEICCRAERRLDREYNCQIFTDWFDTGRRDVVRHELLGEVEEALAERAAAKAMPV